ncbi:MAG TPA: hypothetical protein VNG29_01285 [Candidatus Paceibacterota bacterium]|nr:hypothetical protein [Candidatus Paceibacterota bacterium]
MAAIAFFLLHFLLKCIVLALASITMYFAFHLLSLVLERIFAMRIARKNMSLNMRMD